MSSAQIDEAMAKLGRLSDDRAERVLSLIHDLAELEALETADDLTAARAALAGREEPRPWEEIKATLDARFGLSQPAS